MTFFHPNAAQASGAGSVSEAPNLPAGFADTFSSHIVDAGDVRLHAVTGGAGPPLLLIHGWPQTWYQYRLLMPALARDFQVIAVDQRGIGLSDKPEAGYDTGTLAGDMVALMEALEHPQFALVGFDTGLLISYALAAEHPERVPFLVLGEASFLPGVSPSPPLILPDPLKARLWHIAFNQQDAVNEELVRGRERIFIGAEYDAAAGKRKLPDYAIDHYVETLAADAAALHGSFQLYRAFNASAAQNEQRRSRPLAMPVLAIGGAESGGEMVANTIKLVAEDVQGLVIADCGHWVAEEAPDELLAALTSFLAGYRDAGTHAGAAAG